MKIGIIGCGRLGTQVAQLLQADGVDVWSLRRQLETDQPESLRMYYHDAADAEQLQQLAASEAQSDALLVCANPGLRSGEPNDLPAVAHNVQTHFPDAYLIYTSSTAVYADAGGAVVDEAAAIADTDNARYLLAIEEAFLRRAHSLVLRLSALCGPQRDFLARRIDRAGHCLEVKGPLERWYNYIHQTDAAQIICELLQRQPPLCGVYNLSASEPVTAAEYYQQLIHAAGKQLKLEAVSQDQANKQVSVAALEQHCGRRQWRSLLDP